MFTNIFYQQWLSQASLSRPTYSTQVIKYNIGLGEYMHINIVSAALNTDKYDVAVL